VHYHYLLCAKSSEDRERVRDGNGELHTLTHIKFELKLTGDSGPTWRILKVSNF